MIKKTVTYMNYLGEEVTRDFHFNLNKAELTKMQMTEKGGLAERMQRLVDAKDAPAIIEVFEKLVLDAYGVISPDGERFMKNDEIRAAFQDSPAYPIIFMELATDSDEAAKFINGIVPADMAKAAEAQQKAAAKASHPANK